MSNSNNIQRMPVVIVGHVDHGKSTIIGRLMADTNSLPEGKLDQVKETCKRNSKPFEYAFLLDALKDEQAQGITIDTARCFFKSEKRQYIIIDAPGHVEFLKNMVTGASNAEAALLVVDANEGIQENTRRHGFLLSMLGIKQIAIVINKMDLVNYDKTVYDTLVEQYKAFLSKINLEAESFIPVSGFNGDNVAFKSSNMPWYDGKTVLETLDEFDTIGQLEDKPFRMYVQDVYKFTANGDDRRIVAGTVETGELHIDDEIEFYPSGKRSRVKSFENLNLDYMEEVKAGYAIGFTLEEQIYIKRGEIVTKADELKPFVSTHFRANIFWLGKSPLEKNKKYLLKIGTTKVGVYLEEILKVMDASELSVSKKDIVERHEVSECIFRADKAISFDLVHDIPETSRFIIVDNYDISGGGIILESLNDEQEWIRSTVRIRNRKWIASSITSEERTERYNQKPCVVFITGESSAPRKEYAKALERKLFEEGKFVYYLGMGNIRYGMDADVVENSHNPHEHIRRLAETCNLLMDAGLVVIVSAKELCKTELEVINASIDSERIISVWIGEQLAKDVRYDLVFKEDVTKSEFLSSIKNVLQQRNIIYKTY
ncbi:GTP-binding protein [Clostridium sp. OS1-26]|uniref:GTP-binding protein n=1 Tax=Clostridium sp. OS1-26 TaxID=3070681 RepID=UPI0027E01554|nr:GTP-binding protein [Clostridium sp. OS1-26]WML36766.1 GTP-binding protein [Clostridium sp. OS1-26]